MAVLMTLRVTGDVEQLEALWKEDPEMFRTVGERAKAAGAVHHCFWKGNGEILVVDEWPDEQAFYAFFSGSPEVPQIMGRAGVTVEPQPEFWQRAAVDDAF